MTEDKVKARQSESHRNNRSEAMKRYYSDPKNRHKTSRAMKAVVAREAKRKLIGV